MCRACNWLTTFALPRPYSCLRRNDKKAVRHSAQLYFTQIPVSSTGMTKVLVVQKNDCDKGVSLRATHVFKFYILKLYHCITLSLKNAPMARFFYCLGLF